MEYSDIEYNVKIEQTAGRPLAVMRRRVMRAELSRVIPECCGLVWNVIKSQQVPGAGRQVALYLDDLINVEVGVELESPFAGHVSPGNRDVVGSATPAGRVASTIHFGPYQKLCDAHDAVQQWCGQNGHKLAGPCWEIYGHWQEEWNSNPSLIETEVVYLLK